MSKFTQLIRNCPGRTLSLCKRVFQCIFMAENKVIRPRRPIHWHGDSIAPTLTLFNIGESEFYGNTPRPPLK